MRSSFFKFILVTLCFFSLAAPAFAGGGSDKEEEPKAEAMGTKIASDVWQWDTLEEFEADTGMKITEFNESPMLAERVRAGDLPPVEERIPEEPLVLNVFEEIGKYGGMLRGAGVGTDYTDWTPINNLLGAIQQTNEGPGVPQRNTNYYIKGHEFSDDKMSFTMYMRKGMKWSDGHPYTADDVMFWADLLLDEEYPAWWRQYGQVEKVVRVDDYTVRMEWSRPNPTLMGWIEFWGGWYIGRYPKHYTGKYYSKYSADADKLAKEEGFDYWYQALNRHASTPGFGDRDMEQPMLVSWIPKDVGPNYFVCERNPYHWAIDTAGNQLPYIDTIRMEAVADQETFNMKAIAGEVDAAQFNVAAENIPLFRENADKGGYDVLLHRSPSGSECAYAFNLNHQDPVLRKIFSDIRFRQAMSLAIDREEINNVLYFGQGTVRQASMSPLNSYYKPKWAEAFVKYDVNRANALLDEMGLKWDRDKRYRLRSDGKPISFKLWMHQDRPTLVNTTELVQGFWEKVGMKIDFQVKDGRFIGQVRGANEHDTGIWHLRRTNENKGFVTGGVGNKFIGGAGGGGYYFATNWEAWYRTNGAEGEKPPDHWLEIRALGDEWFVTVDKDDYIRTAQKIFDYFSDQLYIIGTVGFVPVPVIARRNLGNFPRDTRWMGDDTQFMRDLKPEQWYFK